MALREFRFRTTHGIRNEIILPAGIMIPVAICLFGEPAYLSDYFAGRTSGHQGLSCEMGAGAYLSLDFPRRRFS
ncbi:MULTISPECIES: hypothetical protein [unclassified Rhizobium]|uniref:hypothetical protein n=1 Tax=unclassified Rhizobium TaxID=2613769 RepID=UPI0019693889|nr:MULTISPECIES: hypothetical protein [unclassified Rhizobium]